MAKMQIIETIHKLKKPYIIAISGFGGSGKSTFANLLASEIDAPIIGVDDFFLIQLNVSITSVGRFMILNALNVK